MRKILVGLLALWSISGFSQSYLIDINQIDSYELINPGVQRAVEYRRNGEQWDSIVAFLYLKINLHDGSVLNLIMSGNTFGLTDAAFEERYGLPRFSSKANEIDKLITRIKNINYYSLQGNYCYREQLSLFPSARLRHFFILETETDLKNVFMYELEVVDVFQNCDGGEIIKN